MHPEKYFLISDYQYMNLMGVKGLFTKRSLDRESLPEGFYKYTIKEGENYGRPNRRRRAGAGRMGDFVSREELNLNGQDELETFGDYNISDARVDLDSFFGVDIKRKIAEEIDGFYYDFDPYEYADCIPMGCTREDVLESVYDGLSDKSYTEGMIQYLQKVLDDNKAEAFLERKMVQKISSYVRVLTDINSQNRDGLDVVIGMANRFKEEQANAGQGRAPEKQ